MNGSDNRHPIVVPDLGTNETSLKVSAWLVDVGQSVVSGDPVVEVLIPGITFDISAQQTGELVTIEKPVDSTVVSGDILGWIA
jgi:pyruvate/2-oxoglutarate dehydrogenase complex dihydrolipoamide acyltransferase (E2) component